MRSVSSEISSRRNLENLTTSILRLWIGDTKLWVATSGRLSCRLSDCAMACPVGCLENTLGISFEDYKYRLLGLRTWRIILRIIALTESSFNFRSFSLGIFATWIRNNWNSPWVSQDLLALSKSSSMRKYWTARWNKRKPG